MAAGKRRPVASLEKQMIVDLNQDWKSTCVIVGCSASVVKLIDAKFERSGSIESNPKSCRTHNTSPRYDRFIISKSLQNKFKRAAEISRQSRLITHVKVSRQKVSWMLHESGLLARVPAEKTFDIKIKKIGKHALLLHMNMLFGQTSPGFQGSLQRRIYVYCISFWWKTICPTKNFERLYFDCVKKI